MKEKSVKSYLTTAQKRALNEHRAEVSKDVNQAFDTAFAAWKESWFRGGLAINSNPQARAVGPEFDALIALGPDVLPLLIEKLADPEKFLALQLYDAMQHNEKLLVHFEPDDDRILEGEQGRAERVVQAWFANR